MLSKMTYDRNVTLLISSGKSVNIRQNNALPLDKFTVLSKTLIYIIYGIELTQQ